MAEQQKREFKRKPREREEIRDEFERKNYSTRWQCRGGIMFKTLADAFKIKEVRNKLKQSKLLGLKVLLVSTRTKQKSLKL